MDFLENASGSIQTYSDEQKKEACGQNSFLCEYIDDLWYKNVKNI